LTESIKPGESILQPTIDEDGFDVNVDPQHMSDRWHQGPEEFKNMVDEVRQSIYDEEAKEIVTLSNRMNKIVKDSDLRSGADHMTMANSGFNGSVNHTDDQVVFGEDIPRRDDFVVHNTIVSLGHDMEPKKIKLKKKKT